MLIHCTRKLAAKLPDVSETPLGETSPLGTWTANLIVIDRRQCIFLCHDATRYPLFLAGLRKEHFANMGGLFRNLFVECLKTQGLPAAAIRRTELAIGAPRYDTATNRSVLGALNQFGYIARIDAIHTIDHVLNVHPVAESLRLANMPISIYGKSGYWPAKVMREFVESL